MATGSPPSPRPDATPAEAASPAAGNAPDWPSQAADAIVRTVGAVRDKTTGPAITAARWVVYGTFALLVGSVVAVFVAISAVRLLDVYLPDAVVGHRHTWVAHALIGAVFTIFGMILWSRRRPRAKAAE
jgi:predicted lysophospholipase L1 biosynthesis ABC-type transport system permease subunit